jgi:hypothetical protein
MKINDEFKIKKRTLGKYVWVPRIGEWLHIFSLVKVKTVVIV